MEFSVQILGSNSALAAHGRYPTAQVVQHNNLLFLIDCGEGAQMRMSAYHVKRSKIHHIFISHLHGDHYFGLIGLLTSYQLMQRKAPLVIYGPEPLQQIIEVQLAASNSILNYPVTFVVTSGDGKHLLYENENLEIFSFPLQHRIPTTGFLFQEKVGTRRINGEKTKVLQLQKADFDKLKQGNDIEVEGKFYANESLTLAPHAPRSYAFCSDTMFLPELKSAIDDVNLLYHEATFMADAEARALQTGHSTTKQAGELANIVNAHELLIGHFSSKYADTNPLLKETQSVFSNAAVAEEGQIYVVNRRINL